VPGQGLTPIHEAALLGRRDLVDLLLAAGAELDSRSDDGRTPISEAPQGKHPELAKLLQSKGGHGTESCGDPKAAPVD